MVSRCSQNNRQVIIGKETYLKTGKTGRQDATAGGVDTWHGKPEGRQRKPRNQKQRSSVEVSGLSTLGSSAKQQDD